MPKTEREEKETAKERKKKREKYENSRIITLIPFASAFHLPSSVVAENGELRRRLRLVVAVEQLALDLRDPVAAGLGVVLGAGGSSS